MKPRSRKDAPAAKPAPARRAKAAPKKRRRVRPHEADAFREALYAHYREHKRDLPWRRTRDPYKILVSEAMLQQTQVPRVVPKFLSFVARFPNPHALAAAPLAEVLAEWQGLGYNRRAKNLWHAAQALVREHGGKVPKTYEGLRSLPGVGDYTAGAVLAFAFGTARAIIETNVRAVVIHHFYKRKAGVTDDEIISVVEQTIRGQNPRDYYAAIMDYGTHLKATVGNVSRRSKHDASTKKAAFKGSSRQVRGAALRALVGGAATAAAVAKRVSAEIGVEAAKVLEALRGLSRDGLVAKQGRKLTLP